MYATLTRKFDLPHAIMVAPQLEELLAAIDHGQHATEATDPTVITALRFICQETGQPLGVDEVVEVVGSSRRTLERHFRNDLGCTVREAITTAQLLRAKRLLAKTNMPIIDVAMAAGFSYADRLGKVFARVEGMTPTQYRQRATSVAKATGDEDARP